MTPHLKPDQDGYFEITIPAGPPSAGDPSLSASSLPAWILVHYKYVPPSSLPASGPPFIYSASK